MPTIGDCAMKLRNPFRRKAAPGRVRGGAPPRYELWGRDTFEGRSFICGEFEDYEEACNALMRCRQSALSQDEELRDAYWLVRVD